MTPVEEHQLFLVKCKKEKIEPTKELFQAFQDQVEARYRYMTSENYMALERERVRKQQRTVQQTIAEDGAIISPIDDKAYVTQRSWEDHKKMNDVIEVGNEIANKRKKKCEK
jgi:hypothetical protein